MRFPHPTRLVLASLVLLSVCPTARAQDEGVPQFGQRGRVIPSETYYLGFEQLHNGDYVGAMQTFRNAAGGAIRNPQGRWIDSICYFTMMGECLYQQGSNEAAMEQYTAALMLYTQESNWMLRLDRATLAGITPLSQDPREAATWGRSTRNAVMGKYPDRYSILMGNTGAQNEMALRFGGVVDQQRIAAVKADEVARCVGLAIYRRNQILGPLGQQDALNNQLIAIFQRRPFPPNHWMGAWVEAQLGLALAGARKSEQAITTLQKGLLAGGTYDHQLTPLALLQLGHLAMEQQNLEAAGTYFLEATYAAIPFGQVDVIEEAFRELVRVQLVAAPNQVSPQLAAISQWRELRRHDALRVSVLTSIAEYNVYLGDAAKASVALDEARRGMLRRSMATGRIGARHAYVAAMAAYNRGNLLAGSAALSDAVKFNRVASHRSYQVGATSVLFSSNTISERDAQGLFNHLLREPTNADWALDPFETITALSAPSAVAMEQWFNTAITRQEPELALEIADRIRRKRFFAELPLGGRTLALRWILDAPESALGTKALLERQELFGKFPDLKILQERAHEIREALRQMPLQSEIKEDLPKQRKLLAELGQVSDVVETRLSDVALRRVASEFVFPPLKATKEIRQQLEDRQLVLNFFTTSRQVHVFMFTKKDYVHWVLDDVRKTQKLLGDMMKGMGHTKRDASITEKGIADESWKETSHDLLLNLIPELKPEFWSSYDELIVIPDGKLWYLPMEMLHTDDGTGSGDTVPLTEKIAIRYAPTAGLAVPQFKTRPRPQTSVVVAGRLFLSDKSEVIERHYDAVKDAFDAPQMLNRATPGPTNLFSKVWDEVMVLDDVEGANKGPAFAWSPGQIDRGKPGSELASWMRFPLSGPRIIYLPGFHTTAEEGIRPSAGGEEIFLSALGLMSTGTQTIALSRWHSGGAASVDVMAGLAARVHQMPASVALRQSIEDLRREPIDLTFEPRLQKVEGSLPATADHPFLWADTLLIDTGIDPTPVQAVGVP
ncbi:MAG: CHAT domain-containing protein [Pirellulaceae bacterium]